MEFLIIFTLLVFNGLFSLYEMALVSSSKIRLENEAQQGSNGARLALKQLEQPEQTLSTIQIGITLIGIVSGAYGGMAVSVYVEPLFAAIPYVGVYAHQISLALTIVLITYLSIVVGELVPKSVALSKPERYASFFSPAIYGLTWLCFPIVWLLSLSVKVLTGLVGIDATQERPMTQEELRMILRQSGEQGVIDEHEREMLQDVIRFSDKRINELMTPRTEMVVLHLEDTEEEVIETIRENSFSKYLVVGEHRDDVLGVVSVKDIVIMLGRGDTFNLTPLMRDPLKLPESIYARQALEHFKKHKTKFAVVVNEYGGTEGIVTLHDLTESVFGDILEENETEDPEIVKRADGSMLVDGSMNIDDFMEEMAVTNYDDVDEEAFTTLGGMAMFFIGRIPKEGDTFEYQNMQFEVVDMDGERVDKLLLIIKKEEEASED